MTKDSDFPEALAKCLQELALSQAPTVTCTINLFLDDSVECKIFR